MSHLSDYHLSAFTVQELRDFCELKGLPFSKTEKKQHMLLKLKASLQYSDLSAGDLLVLMKRDGKHYDPTQPSFPTAIMLGHLHGTIPFPTPLHPITIISGPAASGGSGGGGGGGDSSSSGGAGAGAAAAAASAAAALLYDGEGSGASGLGLAAAAAAAIEGGSPSGGSGRRPGARRAAPRAMLPASFERPTPPPGDIVLDDYVLSNCTSTILKEMCRQLGLLFGTMKRDVMIATLKKAVVTRTTLFAAQAHLAANRKAVQEQFSAHAHTAGPAEGGSSSSSYSSSSSSAAAASAAQSSSASHDIVEALGGLAAAAAAAAAASVAPLAGAKRAREQGGEEVEEKGEGE